MNGYSEASIVCGGNIGDPGLYLYLANVKQKLQKILKTDREDLLIEKVERWNSIRVTFRLPPSSANNLHSIAQQNPERLRNLGIQSVQVDAGRLVSVISAAGARSADGSNAVDTSASISSTSGVVNRTNSNYSTTIDAATSNYSTTGETSGGLLVTLVQSSSGSGDDPKELEREGTKVIDQSQRSQCTMVAKEIQQQPANVHQQQQNILGYLLDEPDHPTTSHHPPPPPPYQDYNQQLQMVSVSAASSTQIQQDQRWQQQQNHPSNSAPILPWNNLQPQTHASAGQSTGVPEYYYGHQHHQMQQPSHPSMSIQQHNQQYSPSAMQFHQQHDTAPMMAYSSGMAPMNSNNNPAYHHNMNYGQHQQMQQNPGNVSNSPLLVGLLQQNSPPPSQPLSSSTYMQPPKTPIVRNNTPGNLSGYNEMNISDSSPPPWASAASSRSTEPTAGKRQKRGSATGNPPKPKKQRGGGNARGTTAKRGNSKRAGASDGNPLLDPSFATTSATYAYGTDQDIASQQSQAISETPASSTSSSSFNRDNSINSVIDSVLCNVNMAAALSSNISESVSTPEMVTDSKARQSLDSPTVKTKSGSSSVGPVSGTLDETGSQCGSSPMSTTSLSVAAQHQQQFTPNESPTTQFPLQQRQAQSAMRSVSSSSSSSSPVVASGSPTFDPQWHQHPKHAANIGIPQPYGAYHNQPNHQFVRHHPYHPPPDSDFGPGKLRRQPMLRQGPRSTPMISSRFMSPAASNTPGTLSFPSPQTVYDLAHHDNIGRTVDNANAYSNTIPGKSRTPTVNGDVYLSSHAMATSISRHPASHGQQIRQQIVDYGASGSWSTAVGSGDNNGGGTMAETAEFMISSKTTAATASAAYGGISSGGGADHDYLVMSSIESSGNASPFSPFASAQHRQQQPPITNDYYGFPSPSNQPQQQRGDYNYNIVPCRPSGGQTTPIFYNGGDGQQMQEALVARHGSAYVPQQQSAAAMHWEKQQRLARFRHPWPVHSTQQQLYEQQGNQSVGVIYDEESMMRDMVHSVGPSPLANYQATSQQHQSMILPQHHHNHSIAMQQEQQQTTSIDEPMLSGPAR